MKSLIDSLRPRLMHSTLIMCLTLSLLIGSAAFPTPVLAVGSTITVNSTADNISWSNGACTLREAISNANGTAPDEMGPDCSSGLGYTTIKFDASFGTAAIQLSPSLSELSVYDDLTIDGGGDTTLKGSTYNVLVNTADLTLKDLTLANTTNTAVYNVSTQLPIPINEKSI